MQKACEYLSWAYGGTHNTGVAWTQRFVGLGLIGLWYFGFGYVGDKFTYNPVHPYIFVIALVGWLMVRNSSKYLTECHSTFLEFLGRNTLETYVLQFHLFMNHKVQNIPVVIPGSGPDGSVFAQILNMLLCGCIFVWFAVQARKVTVSTQTTFVELVDLLLKKLSGKKDDDDDDDEEEDLKSTEMQKMLPLEPKNGEMA